MANQNNNFLCSGFKEDCSKCPPPIDMNESQLHKAILNGARENCVCMASVVYAKRIAGTISK